MKMKYTAAAALLAWLLVVGWLASMVIAKPAVMRMGNQAEETAATAELRNGVARNRGVAASIAQLRTTAMIDAGGDSLIALPSATAAGNGNNSGNGSTGAAEGEGAATHVISLVLAASGRRVAVIDGQSVRVGARLEDGSRVSAIGQDWVRLDDAAGNRQTLRVTNPLHPEQAGGSR